jgi:hypothetical protein
MEQEILVIVEKIRSSSDSPNIEDAEFLAEVAARIGRIREDAEFLADVAARIREAVTT